MATAKTKAENLDAFPDNTAGAITPELLRDFVESIVPGVGSLHTTVEGTVTDIAGQNVWTVANLAAPILRTAYKFDMPVAGRLRYIGVPDVHVHVAASLSMTTTNNGQTVNMRVVKNGDPDDLDAVASEVDHNIAAAGGIKSTALHFDSMMSNGDYLELWVMNETSAGDVIVRHLYLFALAMMAMADPT